MLALIGLSISKNFCLRMGKYSLSEIGLRFPGAKQREYQRLLLYGRYCLGDAVALKFRYLYLFENRYMPDLDC